MAARFFILRYTLAAIAILLTGYSASAQFVNTGDMSIANGTTMTVRSVFVNKSGGVLANEGQLFLSDSLKNYGDYQHKNGTGVDTVIFTSISPTGIITVADTFGAVRIQGGSIKTLQGTMYVNKELILENGVVQTTPVNPLILRKLASVTGGDNTAYIGGPLTYTGQGPQRRFPVGRSGKYHPVILKGVQGTGATPDDFEISFEAVTGGSPVLGETVKAVSDTMHWKRSINNASNFSKYDTIALNYTGLVAGFSASAKEEYVIAQSDAPNGVYESLGNALVSGDINAGFTRNALDATEDYYALGHSKNNFVKLKVFLQGAYDMPSDSMVTFLNTSGELDTFRVDNAVPVYATQPTMRNFSKMLKNNLGAYEVPARAVDVVQVSARVHPDSADRETVNAWLLSDGTVVDYLSGGSKTHVTFSKIASGSYHLVVRHRNHLDIMTDDLVTISNSIPALYDLTDIDKIYGAGAVKIDNILDVYGMIAGDNVKADMLRETNANDFYRVDVDGNNLILSQYQRNTDILITTHMSVNPTDIDLASDNNDQLYFSTVPY